MVTKLANDTRLRYQQECPKKKGSKSFTRYEKYKVATTVEQALQLGSAYGDLEYDISKGFCKVLDAEGNPVKKEAPSADQQRVIKKASSAKKRKTGDDADKEVSSPKKQKTDDAVGDEADKEVSSAKKSKADERKVAKKEKKKDANAPKRPTGGGYGVYLSENRETILKSLPASANKITDVAKKAGEQWSKLSEAEQQPFKDKYAKKQEEYQLALSWYHEELALEEYKKTLAADAEEAADGDAEEEAEDGKADDAVSPRNDVDAKPPLADQTPPSSSSSSSSSKPPETMPKTDDAVSTCDIADAKPPACDQAPSSSSSSSSKPPETSSANGAPAADHDSKPLEEILPTLTVPSLKAADEAAARDATEAVLKAKEAIRRADEAKSEAAQKEAMLAMQNAQEALRRANEADAALTSANGATEAVQKAREAVERANEAQSEATQKDAMQVVQNAKEALRRANDADAAISRALDDESGFVYDELCGDLQKELKQVVAEKLRSLVGGYGASGPSFLAEYIILQTSGKSLEDVKSEVDVLLQGQSGDFTNWLWNTFRDFAQKKSTRKDDQPGIINAALGSTLKIPGSKLWAMPYDTSLGKAMDDERGFVYERLTNDQKQELTHMIVDKLCDLLPGHPAQGLVDLATHIKELLKTGSQRNVLQSQLKNFLKERVCFFEESELSNFTDWLCNTYQVFAEKSIGAYPQRSAEINAALGPAFRRPGRDDDGADDAPRPDKGPVEHPFEARMALEADRKGKDEGETEEDFADRLRADVAAKLLQTEMQQ